MRKKRSVSGGPRVERIAKVPETDFWSIPYNELNVQLGCVGCANQVCVKGIDLGIPERHALRDIAYEVPKEAIVGQLGAFTNVDPCEEPDCSNSEAIETALSLIDERFGSNLMQQLPTDQ
jgi:hypothetical protein